MNYNKEHVARKQKALVSKARKNSKKASVITVKAILIGIVALGVIGLGSGLGTMQSIIDNAPTIDAQDVQPDGFLTTVYDQSGNELITLSDYDSNRIYVEIDKIPKHLQDAFVAIEDERFYDHNGIDLRGILRAFYVGITNGSFSEGASTITQQLLKNNVFAVFGEDTFIERFERKIQEQFLALKLEETLTKEEILEYYLNTINLGQRSLGVQAASLRYFNKDVSQLTLSESAVLAGITKNPSGLDPVNHPEDNKERRNTILERMLKQELISEAEYEEAFTEDVYEHVKQVDTEQSESSVYSYFVDAAIVQIIEDLQEKNGYNQTQAYNALYRGGLNIYLTQDADIQKICDDVLNNEANYPSNTNVSLTYRLSIQRADGTDVNYSEYDIDRFLKKKRGTNKNTLTFTNKGTAEKAVADFKASVYNEEDGDVLLGESMTTTIQPQISFTIMDQYSGQVKAIVGGRGKKEGNLTLNRATGTTRQPGSTFKIVSTFIPALDTAGYTLASVFDDAPYNWPNTNISVKNYYSSGYRGLSTIRTAIRDSMNIVTAKTMEEVTPQVAYDYLLNLGFTTLVDKQVDSNGNVYSDIQHPTSLGGITNGVTNLELTASYAAIANNGLYTKPLLYTKVTDQDGNVILSNETPETNQVMKESTAWLITNAMKDVVNSGTGTRARMSNITSAGKTGTTSNNFDFWFSGYSPYYTASIWYGYDINTSFSANNVHTSLWKVIMDKVHTAKNLPNKKFPSTSSITTASICSKSGKLAVEGVCDHDPRGSMIRTEYFAKGTVPTEECDVHVKLSMCWYSKLPAGPYCPPHALLSGVFILRPEGSVGETADTPYELPYNYQDYICDVHSSRHTELIPPNNNNNDTGNNSNDVLDPENPDQIIN